MFQPKEKVSSASEAAVDSENKMLPISQKKFINQLHNFAYPCFARLWTPSPKDNFWLITFLSYKCAAEILQLEDVHLESGKELRTRIVYD